MPGTDGYEASDDAPAEDLLADEDEDGDIDLAPELPEDCTSNAANWQYPHDSSAHFLEDALEHGHADAVDDSILEKGNRRKKRLGDRCVFRGGTNEPGAKST